MKPEIIVQNIEKYCRAKGLKPTPACRDSGAGENFLQDIKGGKSISVKRLQLLATYLNITTSDLLGEEKPAGNETSGLSKEMIEIIELYDKASPEMQAAALGMLRAAEAARSAPGVQKGGK